jgi:hypothetical protein
VQKSTGEVVVSQQPKCIDLSCREADVKFLKMPEVKGILYRYAISLKTSNGDGGFASLWNFPQFYHTLEDAIKNSGFKIYLGFEKNNSFVLPITAGSFTESDNVPISSRIWYVFNAFRENNQIYIKIIDKFLPGEYTLGKLEQFD